MPIASQTRNRTQVSVVRFSMSQKHSTAERIGSTGDHGTRNPRGRSGRVRRSTTMPRLTSTNADSVPMLIISSSRSTSVNAGDEGDGGAADDLDASRRLACASVVFDEPARQQAVAAQREDDAREAEQQHHDHGREADERRRRR